MAIHDALRAGSALNSAPVLAAPSFALNVGDQQSDMALAVAALAAADPVAETATWNSLKASLPMTFTGTPGSVEKPFAFVNGIAIIPIYGMLLNRFPYCWSFVTGYQFIQTQLRAALADDDVTSIVFDVNSGGGVCAGCDECAQEIFNSRSVKPSVAIVDAFSYSAAYFLASSASKMWATPSSGVGSIGVIGIRMDYTEMMKQAGIKSDVMIAGANKTDTNPLVPFTDEAKARYQAQIDDMYTMFVSAIVRNRGLTDAAVRKTEASTYSAANALKLGLIDGVAAPEYALEQALASFEDSDDQDPNPNDEDDDDMAAKTPEQIAQEEAVTKAGTDERARIGAIMNHPEATGREKQARYLAFETSMSAEDAGKILAVGVKEAAPAAPAAPAAETGTEPAKPAPAASTGGGAANHFDNAMGNQPATGVKPGATDPGSEASALSATEQVLQAQDMAMGTTKLPEYRKRQTELGLPL